MQIFTRFIRSLNIPVGSSKVHVTRSGNNYDVRVCATWITSMLVRHVNSPLTQLYS